MKIDEVSGAPEIPNIRSQDLARQTELERQNVQPPQPPDQVDVSQAVRAAQTSDPTGQVQKLRALLQNSPRIDAQALAAKLQKDGVL